MVKLKKIKNKIGKVQKEYGKLEDQMKSVAVKAIESHWLPKEGSQPESTQLSRFLAGIVDFLFSSSKLRGFRYHTASSMPPQESESEASEDEGETFLSLIKGLVGSLRFQNL